MRQAGIIPRNAGNCWDGKDWAGWNGLRFQFSWFPAIALNSPVRPYSSLRESCWLGGENAEEADVQLGFGDEVGDVDLEMVGVELLGRACFAAGARGQP